MKPKGERGASRDITCHLSEPAVIRLDCLLQALAASEPEAETATRYG
jgi:hypothetical protein